jgi:hypothetical protein
MFRDIYSWLKQTSAIYFLEKIRITAPFQKNIALISGYNACQLKKTTLSSFHQINKNIG